MCQSQRPAGAVCLSGCRINMERCRCQLASARKTSKRACDASAGACSMQGSREQSSRSVVLGQWTESCRLQVAGRRSRTPPRQVTVSRL